MLSVRKAKETFKILSKECKNELYVTCNIFLNYMKTKKNKKMCEWNEKVCERSVWRKTLIFH